jgi:hypothetical protein
MILYEVFYSLLKKINRSEILKNFIADFIIQYTGHPSFLLHTERNSVRFGITRNKIKIRHESNNIVFTLF